jgi:hypothetical protein
MDEGAQLDSSKAATIAALQTLGHRRWWLFTFDRRTPRLNGSAR